jgi:hypothetical protein
MNPAAAQMMQTAFGNTWGSLAWSGLICNQISVVISGFNHFLTNFAILLMLPNTVRPG